MSEERVVVIGAGPAGLASAAELGRRGIAVTVLEQSDAIAASWRGRYDKLRLNSSRPFSKLPGERYARGTPIFPSRDQLVGYLEGYAARNGVQVRLGTRLERIDRNGDGWVLRTSTGDLLAKQVIVAAGYEHTPIIPDWPGLDRLEKRFITRASTATRSRSAAPTCSWWGPGPPGWRSPTTSPRAALGVSVSRCGPRRTSSSARPPARCSRTSSGGCLRSEPTRSCARSASVRSAT
jgi:glycine/D-amino acid oxidase-like deaminating enzyme